MSRIQGSGEFTSDVVWVRVTYKPWLHTDAPIKNTVDEFLVWSEEADIEPIMSGPFDRDIKGVLTMVSGFYRKADAEMIRGWLDGKNIPYVQAPDPTGWWNANLFRRIDEVFSEENPLRDFNAVRIRLACEKAGIVYIAQLAMVFKAHEFVFRMLYREHNEFKFPFKRVGDIPPDVKVVDIEINQIQYDRVQVALKNLRVTTFDPTQFPWHELIGP